MNKRISSIIFPNQKISIYVLSLLIIGVISGTIFLVLLGDADKMAALNQIKEFFVQINKGNIISLKNSLLLNITYLVIIFLMGISIVGLVINSLIVYVKGFILGFSLAAMFYAYKFKGILAGIIYLFPHQIINILLITTLTIYSIIFSISLIKQIFNKKVNTLVFLKQFTIIFIFTILLSIITAVLETYLMPALLKIIINLYV